MKDLAILCIAALVLVFALVELKIYTPAVVTLYFGFLTIRKDDATVLYYIKYAVRYFKVLSEQGFDVHRMKKPMIKRLIALYFDASLTGENIPDYDGEQYFNLKETEMETLISA